MKISLLLVVSLFCYSLHHASCKLTEDQWNRGLKGADGKSRVITGRRLGDETLLSHTMDVVRPARESMSALKMPPPMARVKSLIIQRALKGVKKKLDGKSPVTTGRRLGHGEFGHCLARAY
jgi:hypothetical protein